MRNIWCGAISALLLTWGVAWAQSEEWIELGPRTSVQHSVDPFTDEDNSIVIIQAYDYPSYNRASGVVVRCASRTPPYEVFLPFDTYLGSGESSYAVMTRFDDGEVETWQMAPSNSNDSGFVRRGETEEFLQRLRNSQELVFRVEDYQGRQYTYAVDLTRLNEAIEYLDCVN